LEKFKDPSSHYHIPPGTRGPEHEDDHSSSRHPTTTSSTSTSKSAAPISSSSFASANSTGKESGGDEYQQSRLAAMEMFRAEGFDVEGTLEWPVAWGDCDMFQYVFILILVFLVLLGPHLSHSLYRYLQLRYHLVLVESANTRHVNNVRYVRWIETARIRYAESFNLPQGQVRGMLVSTSLATLPTENARTEGKELTDRAGKGLDLS